jgi:hypothetical protein
MRQSFFAVRCGEAEEKVDNLNKNTENDRDLTV